MSGLKIVDYEYWCIKLVSLAALFSYFRETRVPTYVMGMPGSMKKSLNILMDQECSNRSI